MSRGYSPADESQRSEELYVFSTLQNMEGLPIACHDDDPDFYLESGLGVEVTRYHPDAGPTGSAHVATSRLRTEVLNRAASRYQQAQPSEPIILSARWLDVDLARRNRSDMATVVAGAGCCDKLPEAVPRTRA